MDGAPPGGNMWVTYSMNKEDIWVSKIPIPVRDRITADVNDNFAAAKNLDDLQEWNIYSPTWCRVELKAINNEKSLIMHDSDPFDFSKVERVFPDAKKVNIEFSIIPDQDSYGNLEIELVDTRGTPCLRLMFDSTGSILTKQGYRNKSLGKYIAGQPVAIKMELNTATRFYTVIINDGKASSNICFAPVSSVNRIIFRTGSVRRFPDADTPTDQAYDLPNADGKDREASFSIRYLKTKKQ